MSVILTFLKWFEVTSSGYWFLISHILTSLKMSFWDSVQERTLSKG